MATSDSVITNSKLQNYLREERLNYLYGLVTKDDVAMWLSFYAKTLNETNEAKKQIELWDKR